MEKRNPHTVLRGRVNGGRASLCKEHGLRIGRYYAVAHVGQSGSSVRKPTKNAASSSRPAGVAELLRVGVCCDLKESISGCIGLLLGYVKQL